MEISLKADATAYEATMERVYAALQKWEPVVAAIFPETHYAYRVFVGWNPWPNQWDIVRYRRVLSRTGRKRAKRAVLRAGLAWPGR